MLKPPPKEGIARPVPLVLTDPNACSNAARVMADVWKNEETRFNNLNTRGATVLSATALVTSILAFFSKSLLDSGLSRWRHDIGLWGAIASIALLIISAGIVLFGVLSPNRALVFGGNDLTNGALDDLTSQQIDKIVYDEYAQIFTNLANRSRRKGWFLWLAYWPFAVALLTSGVTTAIVLVTKN